MAELVRIAGELDIDIVWDTVLNHKTAGDRTDECWAVEVDKEGVQKDRRHMLKLVLMFNRSKSGDLCSSQDRGLAEIRLPRPGERGHEVLFYEVDVGAF